MEKVMTGESNRKHSEGKAVENSLLHEYQHYQLLA